MSGDPLVSPEARPGRWKLAALLRQSSFAHGMLLGLFAFATAFALTSFDDMTRGAIASRAAEDLRASLAQVIPDELHDNDVTTDTVMVDGGKDGPVKVYRARRDGAVTAVAFEMTGYGYGGRIEVLLGIDPKGELLGVRVLLYTETPGLGDKIEAAKSGWILGFAGLSLRDPAPAEWKVKRDGGVFDQFSGATITPRAVVGAVRRGLELFDRSRAELLAADVKTAHAKEPG